MTTNPALAEAIANVHAALAERGAPSPREQHLIEQICLTAPREMPDLGRAAIGESMVHFVRMLDALTKAIRGLDPLLDWESTLDIALNVLGIAGAELYETGQPVATDGGEPA